jgi:tRNA dimethylallyltransferase
MSKYLVVIAGPTASGKTKVGIELAKHFDTEILSADSRQFYREMNVGTAKPTAEELAAAKHHFVNTLSINDDYSAGDYERDALKTLKKLFKKKDVVLMVGGSGLFIQAVTEGLNEFPEVPEGIRETLTAEYEKHGLWKLQKELKESDPDYYQFVDLTNHQRLIRALEICRATGQPYSSFRNQEKKERDFETIFVVLKRDRESLYERINMRVDLMMRDKLHKEVEGFLENREANALQTVGYQEFFGYFDEDYDIYEAIRLVKRNSRRYAKRQLTWFRKVEGAKFIDAEDIDAVLAYVEARIAGEIEAPETPEEMEIIEAPTPIRGESEMETEVVDADVEAEEEEDEDWNIEDDLQMPSLDDDLSHLD